MSTSLKKAIRQQFAQLSLNDQQVQRLLALEQQQRKLSPKTAFFRYKQSLRHAIIGAVFATFLTLFLVNNNTSSLPDLIAAEVAENHLNLKPADIETSNMDDIQRYFTALDFIPRQSQLIAANQDWQLTGGRYCSIQGKTAAQLRLSHAETGKIQTIYQVPYEAKKYAALPNIQTGESPLTTFSRGLKVQIWVENGILYAMTNE